MDSAVARQEVEVLVEAGKTLHNIAIIGGGIAGMAAAIRLAKKGKQVTLFDKNEYLGGKMSSYSSNGFRWDCGPSLFTLPEEYFKLEELVYGHRRLKVERLANLTNYFWDDGTQLEAPADNIRFAEILNLKLNIDSKDTLDFLKSSEDKYKMTEKVFLRSSLHKKATYLSKSAFFAYPKMNKLEAFKTMHKSNADRFKKSEKAVQLFDRFATYNGSNPYKAPATLNIIPYLEFGIGAYYPENGMISIKNGLEQMLIDLGVTIKLNKVIEKVNFISNSQLDIYSGSQTYKFDALVNATDVYQSSLSYLKNTIEDKSDKELESSSSAIIFLWGMEGNYPEFDLHNILFSNNYLKEFYHIFNLKTLSDDLTIYINISSKKTKEDAPEGKENWFVMVNSPCNERQDWNQIIPKVRESIINRIETVLKREIKSEIIEERVLTPEYIQNQTGSFKGALYGPASNNRFSAFLRQANFSSKQSNVFFCGGSVHPGGGIPLCLMGAEIVSNLIK